MSPIPSFFRIYPPRSFTEYNLPFKPFGSWQEAVVWWAALDNFSLSVSGNYERQKTNPQGELYWDEEASVNFSAAFYPGSGVPDPWVLSDGPAFGIGYPAHNLEGNLGVPVVMGHHKCVGLAYPTNGPAIDDAIFKGVYLYMWLGFFGPYSTPGFSFAFGVGSYWATRAPIFQTTYPDNIESAGTVSCFGLTQSLFRYFDIVTPVRSHVNATIS